MKATLQEALQGHWLRHLHICDAGWLKTAWRLGGSYENAGVECSRPQGNDHASSRA